MYEQHSYIENFVNPYKFNGKEQDIETGLYYYGARYYDPKMSIWLSVDPLTEKMPNSNPYNYTMQNPINLTDPTGMYPEVGTENKPPFNEKDTEKLNKAKEYIGGVISKKNDRIDRLNAKINKLKNKQDKKFKEGRKTRIASKTDKISEQNNQIINLQTAISKINILMDPSKHNYSFQIGSDVGRDMGENIQEAGNLTWGSTNRDITVNTNSSVGTLIHELSHLYDVVFNKFRYTAFAAGTNIGFYNEGSEIIAYKLTYSLGGSLPAPVKGGVMSINSEWFNENLRKVYSKKK